MNQLRVPSIRFNHVSFAPDAPWIAIGIALMAITGWSLADVAIDQPGVLLRLFAALLAPAALLISLAFRELCRAWLTGTERSPQLRHLYPSGTRSGGFHLFEAPPHEFRHSVTGPLISLLLALILLAPIAVVSADSLAGRLLLGSSLLNALLASVNILPAFPFDGGAILRAIFWFLHDDHSSATRIAFVYGQLVASGSLGYGLVLLAWRSDLLLPGLWCTVLGWMVVRASRAELLRSHLISRASRVRAADAVTGLNPTIRASERVSEAVDILLEQKDNGPGLVRDRDRFVGMLTVDSLRSVPRNEWRDLEVRDVMTSFDEITDSPPDADLLSVLRIQSDTNARVVVVRHSTGDVAGLVSEDIAPRLLLRRAESRSIEPRGSEARSGPQAGA